MHRRRFLAMGSAVAAVFAVPRLFAQAEDISPAPPDLAAQLGQLLVTDSPELMHFAETVYATCIFGKLRAPSPPLAHAFLVPGGGYYAQWLWDTMFVADLLAIFSAQAETIRGVFQNYWDFQQRWNTAQPAYRHGMIANFMAPFDAPAVRDGKQWRTFPAYSQAPLLAWGMERVYRRNGDMQLLKNGLAPLESFHEWYWRERDIYDQGLIGVGAYSGDPQHARYETYDREVDLDGLRMVPHPHRSSTDNGAWYGDIAIPANTAYLLLSEQALARMADICGDHALAARRRARCAKGTAAMRRHMWDTEMGCFLAVRTSTVHAKDLSKIRTATIGGFMPLMAGIPSAQQANAMAATLATPDWATPLPIPTVARTSPQFNSSEFWRGDTWPAPNYQVVSGLVRYGHRELAARIADAGLANAMRVGISERYDSISGAPLGVSGLGMSSTLLTMALDGLTSSRFSIRVRKEN